jgi:hypothetical protein
MDLWQRPWHAGYRRGHSKRSLRRREPPRWWSEGWLDVDMNVGLVEAQYEEPITIEHPVDLIGSSRSPNFESLAIEFVQYGNQFLLTTQQYAIGSALVRRLCARFDIPTNRLGVLGHEDLTPWYRQDAGGGWDPGQHRSKPRFDMDAMLELALYKGEEQRRKLVNLVSQRIAIGTPTMPAWLDGRL